MNAPEPATKRRPLIDCAATVRSDPERSAETAASVTTTQTTPKPR